MQNIFKRSLYSLVVFLVLAQSAFALNTVSLNPEYYPNPTIGRALSNANIYVGIIDLDPETPANQKQISVLQENGATVEVTQPILTGAGGVPLYNGSPVTVLVDGSYSLKVTSSTGSQVYYVPKNIDVVQDAIDALNDLVPVDSIADLGAIDYGPEDGQVVRVLGYYAKTENRDWSFQWSSGDFSTEVAIDPKKGIYVSLNSDPLGFTGAFVRLKQDAILHPEWFGATVDSNAEPFIAATIAYAETFATVAEGTQPTIIDLGGLRYTIDDPLVLREGYLVIQNGRIVQSDNTKDVIQTDGTGNSKGGLIFFVDFLSLDLEIDGTATTNSGSLIRHLAGTLGWFTWENSTSTNNGGKHGFINGYNTVAGEGGFTGGNLFFIEFNRVWFADTFSSPIIIDQQGRVFDMTSNAGGITTITIKNFAVARIISSDFAIRVNATEAILENVTMDFCTRTVQARCKQLNITNIATEFMRAPIDPTQLALFLLEPDHRAVDIAASNLELQGFKNAIDGDYLADPHPDFIQCYVSQSAGAINGFTGNFPTDFADPTKVTRIENVASDINTSMQESAYDKRLTQGITHYLNSRQAPTSQVTTAQAIFPIDTLKPRAYLITTTYSFGGVEDIQTWIVHTSDIAGGSVVSSSVLLPGNMWGDATITGDGTDVILTPPNGNKAVFWSAIDLLAI